MSKLVKFGAGGVKNVKEIYIGIGGAVKKVKAGYIGIGSAVKQFLSANPFTYILCEARSAQSEKVYSRLTDTTVYFYVDQTSSTYDFDIYGDFVGKTIYVKGGKSGSLGQVFIWFNDDTYVNSEVLNFRDASSFTWTVTKACKIRFRCGGSSSKKQCIYVTSLKIDNVEYIEDLKALAGNNMLYSDQI